VCGKGRRRGLVWLGRGDFVQSYAILSLWRKSHSTFTSYVHARLISQVNTNVHTNLDGLLLGIGNGYFATCFGSKARTVLNDVLCTLFYTVIVKQERESHAKTLSKPTPRKCSEESLTQESDSGASLTLAIRLDSILHGTIRVRKLKPVLLLLPLHLL
jgi:hypothetical protein